MKTLTAILAFICLALAFASFACLFYAILTHGSMVVMVGSAFGVGWSLYCADGAIEANCKAGR